MMRDLDQRLDAWLQAGLLSTGQVEDIRRHESARHVSPRSSLAEVTGYVGAALALAAIVLLLGDLWQDIAWAGRLALVSLLTVLLASGGAALRTQPAPASQRLASVLLTGALAGVGWLATLLAGEGLSWSDERVLLTVGIATLVPALPLYLLRPRALPQLTLLAAVAITVAGAFAQAPLTPEPVWVGLTFWALGAGWLLLGAGGWLHPGRLAEIVGGIGALLAAQVASFDSARLALLLLALATAGALVGLALVGERVEHLGVGAVGLFVLVPQVVFELFGEAVGAAATLLIVGLLLVLLAVGLARAGRRLGPDATGADGGSGAPPQPTSSTPQRTPPAGGRR